MRYSSIADALFPRTRQRLLAALLLKPQQPAYAAELAKYLGVRSSTLQRDLAKLTSAGILKRSRDGNRAYFQADESCSIFPELRLLLLKTVGLVDFLRAQLTARRSKRSAPWSSGIWATPTSRGCSTMAALVTRMTPPEPWRPSLFAPAATG